MPKTLPLYIDSLILDFDHTITRHHTRGEPVFLPDVQNYALKLISEGKKSELVSFYQSLYAKPIGGFICKQALIGGDDGWLKPGFIEFLHQQLKREPQVRIFIATKSDYLNPLLMINSAYLTRYPNEEPPINLNNVMGSGQVINPKYQHELFTADNIGNKRGIFLRLMELAAESGHPINPVNSLFIDDDASNLPQARELGFYTVGKGSCGKETTVLSHDLFSKVINDHDDSFLSKIFSPRDIFSAELSSSFSLTLPLAKRRPLNSSFAITTEQTVARASYSFNFDSLSMRRSFRVPSLEATTVKTTVKTAVQHTDELPAPPSPVITMLQLDRTMLRVRSAMSLPSRDIPMAPVHHADTPKTPLSYLLTFLSPCSHNSANRGLSLDELRSPDITTSHGNGIEESTLLKKQQPISCN